MSTSQMLPLLDEPRPPSVADQVFEALYDRVVNLTLPPGTRLSEADVAAQMGVSRQPVRDAFYRLSQLGFIQIRPQRATLVTPISYEGVMQAYFIRSALEEACMRTAALRLTPRDLDALDALVARQEQETASDRRAAFHALDDQFHHDICHLSGLEFVWTLVKENKGHMDRARYLSLSYNTTRVIHEHHQIMTALRARDADGAVAAIRHHLSQIESIFDRIRQDRPDIVQTQGV